MRFKFHPEARAEFLEATLWYEERSPKAGDGFVNAMHLALTAIGADPVRYQSLEAGIRVFRLRKYPFRIYYDISEVSAEVRILAVMHEKKRPDYWRKRISDE